DVQEGLKPDPDAEARSDAGMQRHAGVGRDAREPEAAQHDDEEGSDDRRNAEETEFLRKNSEDEIGMGFRQVKKLLDARSESDADPFAPSDRDQRLRELEATVEGIGPRV